MPGWGSRGEWAVDYFSGTGIGFISTDAFPAPDTDPYEPVVRSNLRTFVSITGQRVGIYPQEKSRPEEITMTWTRMSGSWLKERIQDYVESGTGLRVTPHTGPAFSGVFMELRPRARPGHLDSPGYPNRQTVWDIQADFLPINVESGT